MKNMLDPLLYTKKDHVSLKFSQILILVAILRRYQFSSCCSGMYFTRHCSAALRIRKALGPGMRINVAQTMPSS